MRTVRCSSRLLGEVSARMVSIRGGGCIPACTEADPPREQNNWQTSVKTSPCRNLVADSNKWESD